jgi:streptogramin lyase
LYSPSAIISADSAIWTTAIGAFSGTHGALERTTTSGVFTEFTMPMDRPGALVFGQDGNFWMADGSDNINRVTPQGNVTPFFVASGAATQAIAMAADGSIWFTGSSIVGHMDETGTLLGIYPLPSNLAPVALAIGPDGRIWIAEWDISGPPWKGDIGVLAPSGSASGK